MQIRPATPADLPALTELRNWYIAHSVATFDEQPLTVEAMRAWFSQFGDGAHRLLVAADDARLLGYCSSQAYRPHPAFHKTVETSIYVAPGQGGRGVGASLYGALLPALAREDLHRVVVGIALPNEASVRLHQKLGFRRVGVFDEYACKHGRFISSQWMELALARQRPPVPAGAP